ncbi:hypothetical protein P886_5027 [Alteromonadaceae bacterium 2753L.S.0a.02]|nr:hypothetical protein P886_5027 [Alteromonadaceae bacterium 2753L.S.0a.02]
MNKAIVCICLCAAVPVFANPDVTSREYKLMLDASEFAYNSESSDVADLLDDVETVVESAISRNVSGSASLTKIRDVKFFDTSGSCLLKNIGYSFRERIENGNSEVTLKFRSPDRYISDFEDLSASSGSAEEKLESDIGSSSTTDFKIVYGHSTKAPNTRTINKMDDINDQFPGFDDDYNLSNSMDLDLVGNLTIREHVYKGVDIDLGQFDAEISVTLWYNGVPSGSQAPVVAEVSFKYEDSSADYTKAVVNRAKTAFHAMQSLSNWVDSNSQTKTQFVYEYSSTFCN